MFKSSRSLRRSFRPSVDCTRRTFLKTAMAKQTEMDEKKFDKFQWHLQTQRSTLNQEEVEKFRSTASEWWNTNGPAKGLHSMNSIRVPFVREGLEKTGKVRDEHIGTAKALQDLRILDVGCGAGILSEALARLGASVVALDACEENIYAGQKHLQTESKDIEDRITYHLSTVEDYLSQNNSEESLFDAIVASEVIEHVDNQEEFVKVCSGLLKPGGSIFFTTLNRTRESYIGGIVAAEYVLGLLPKGTHDWNKFVKPEELQTWLETVGCEARQINGSFYLPYFDKWSWIPSVAVNYAIHAVKSKN